MAKKLQLSLACGEYEIVRPLIEGVVQPDGIELTVLTDMTSDIRHWRMIRNREFDVCELSMSSYLMARFKGQAFTAIPVFLHRRFRHGFTFSTDTGVGIPAGLLPHIFEPFVQHDATIERAMGGLGLGLAIVRSLVELHGGTATVASEGAGKGATFTVTFPALPAAAVAAPPAP